MAVYTFIQDNSIIDLEKAKKVCRVDNDDWDDILEIMLAGIKQQADQYCQTDFADYGDEVPMLVELWILKVMRATYDRPNLLEVRRDIEDEGAQYFRFEWAQYIEDLSTFRMDVGFG